MSDSWIKLVPGSEVQIDARLSEIWNKKKREYREVRGNVLAACFEIEFTLDQVLCEIFFPGLDKTPEERSGEENSIPMTEDAKALKSLFSDLFLKGASASLARKIRLLGKLSSQIPVVQKLAPLDLVTRLDGVRDMRNRFAHYPISFVPSGAVPNQDLAAHLDCRDKSLVLDQTFFAESSALFSSVGKDLNELFTNLRENVSRV